MPLEGVGADHTSPAIPERQALVRMAREAQTYWGHILLYRIAGAKWITCDPLLEVHVVDLSKERVIPIAAGQRYPLIARPVLAVDYLTGGELATVRAQALRFADIYGIVSDVAALQDGASFTAWYFSDPAYSDFAEEVSDALVGSPFLLVSGARRAWSRSTTARARWSLRWSCWNRARRTSRYGRSAKERAETGVSSVWLRRRRAACRSLTSRPSSVFGSLSTPTSSGDPPTCPSSIA